MHENSLNKNDSLESNEVQTDHTVSLAVDKILNHYSAEIPEKLPKEVQNIKKDLLKEDNLQTVVRTVLNHSKVNEHGVLVPMESPKETNFYEHFYPKFRETMPQLFREPKDIIENVSTGALYKEYFHTIYGSINYVLEQEAKETSKQNLDKFFEKIWE